MAHSWPDRNIYLVCMVLQASRWETRTRRLPKREFQLLKDCIGNTEVRGSGSVAKEISSGRQREAETKDIEKVNNLKSENSGASMKVSNVYQLLSLISK